MHESVAVSYTSLLKNNAAGAMSSMVHKAACLEDG